MQYQYYKGDKEYTIAATKCYADKKQEMDKLLETIIAPVLRGKKLSVLDAGCGVGHLSFLLSKLAPRSKFFGVDQTPFIIAEAKELYKKAKQLSFAVGDVESLPKQYPKAFDATVSRAVISWIPYYEEHMRALLAVTKKHIFVSSLFYDGDIDFITQVREFQKEAGKNSFSEYRNIYSIPHFKKFVFGLGAKNIDVTDFDIGIDIPRKTVDYMGTYTVKLENGKRMQMSGAMVMSWKWIRIDL